MPRNILVEERFGRTRSGKTELFSIIGPNDFDNPKPSKLISYFLSLFPNKNCLVLDFFAGSGTTLNAVMRSNFLDGGHRSCILVTNNEDNICETVTYPRNRNVILGYMSNGKNNVLLFSEKINLTKFKSPSKILDKIKHIKDEKIDDFNSFKLEIKDGIILLYGILDKSVEVKGLSDNNLRYYRTEFVSRERTQKNRRELMDKSTDLLCIKEDLYTELPKFGRIGLNPKGARYFANDKKQMLIIYRPEFVPCFVDEIDKMKIAEPIKVYVYAPDRYAYDDEFAIVADKVSLCALPQNIIDVMARIMPDKVSEKTIAAAAPTIEAQSIGQDTLFGDIENKEA